MQRPSKLRRIGLSLLVFSFAWIVWFWPRVPIRAWQPPPILHPASVLQSNRLLEKAELLGGPEMIEPEDTAIDGKGRIYGSCLDGKIRRLLPEGPSEVFADTGGRPLGMTFDKKGNLLVADAIRGLVAIEPDGKMEVLADRYEGQPFLFTNNLVLDDEGVIYFTDASRIVAFRDDIRKDALAHQATGRVFRFDPKTRKLDLLLDGLFFANGITFAHDKQSLLIAETFTYSVRRFWLKGPRAGQQEVFSSGLPGFPDNLKQSSDGGYWLALVTPRVDLADRLHPHPWLKTFVILLPGFLQPKAARVGLFVKLDPKGQISEFYDDPDGLVVPNVSSVNEHNGFLYIGHIYNGRHGIGRVRLPSHAKTSTKTPSLPSSPRN